jgi:hypothetical protein
MPSQASPPGELTRTRSRRRRRAGRAPRRLPGGDAPNQPRRRSARRAAASRWCASSAEPPVAGGSPTSRRWRPGEVLRRLAVAPVRGRPSCCSASAAAAAGTDVGRSCGLLVGTVRRNFTRSASEVRPAASRTRSSSDWPDADRVEDDLRGRDGRAEVDVDQVLDDVRRGGVARASATPRGRGEGVGEDRAEVVGADLAAVWVPRLRKWPSAERAICSSW